MPITPGGFFVYNFGNAPAISTGENANIPTTGSEGQLYFTIDTLQSYIYTGGSWQLISGGGGGGSQTWQQTLDVVNGSVLTHDNVISVRGNDFTLNNVGNLNFNLNNSFNINELIYGGVLLNIDVIGNFQFNSVNAGQGFNLMKIFNDGSFETYVNKYGNQFTLQSGSVDGSIVEFVNDGTTNFQSSAVDSSGSYQRIANNGVSALQTLYIGSDGTFQITGINNSTPFPNLSILANGDFTINGNNTVNQGAQLATFSFANGNTLYSSDSAGNVRGAISQTIDGAEIAMYLTDSVGTSYIETFRMVGQDIQTGLATVAHINSQTTITDDNTTATDESAVLEVRSSRLGFLPPRLTTLSRISIPNPATGLMVYDTTLNQMAYYNGADWVIFH